jgi:hypothetical protein
VAYQLQVVDRATRISRLSQGNPTGHVLQVKYRGAYRDMPCKVVPLDTPIYRMRNIRTRVKQKGYILDHGVADTFFKAGAEDVSAQRAQHAFLADLARQGDGGSIARILEREREQTQPLLATYDGVIVNGNRRLAAMREIFAAHPEDYASFEHVELAILPDDATEDDLTEIETDLQIAPEGKLEYGWVEEALGLREQLDELGWSMDRARAHWMETREELNRRLAQLDLANEYLTSIGQPERYELVSLDDLAFQAFLRSQRNRTAEPPTRLEAEKRLAFALINKKDQVAGRVYSLTGSIKPITDRVLANPAVGLPEATPDTDEQPDTPADPLADLPEDESPIAQEVLDFLGDTANWDTLAEAAEQAYTDMRVDARQTQRSLKFAGDAARINGLVAGLSLANSDPASLPIAAAQLTTAIGGIAATLRELAGEFAEIGEGLDKDALENAKRTIDELIAPG